MDKIHRQLKQRRESLGLTQEDMTMRVGMSRQQYQRLESKGNPRLDTLELVAKGLKMQLMLIPQEKARDIEGILAGTETIEGGATGSAHAAVKQAAHEDDPWKDLLGNDNE
jgi:transcriptional regulator with XRE-family HTH domain